MKKRIFVIFCAVIAAQWTIHGYKGYVSNTANPLCLLNAYAVTTPSADPRVIVHSLHIAEGAIDIDGEVCNKGDRDFVPPGETGAVIKIELKNDPDAQSDPASITLKYHEVRELKTKKCIPFTGTYRINDFIPAGKSADEKCGETDKYLIFSIVPIDPCNIFFPKAQDSDGSNNKIIKRIKMNIKCPD